MSLFDRVALAIFVPSYNRFGSKWAMRITFFLHAIPFYAAAWLFGWVSCWVWGSVIPPNIGGWLCAGGVMLLTARNWFKEWRRG